MKVFGALILVIILTMLGYFFWTKQSKEDLGDKPKVNLESCGPGGCGAESMIHSVEIKNEKVFIEEMIPHHQEAIDTSKLVLGQTSDGDLKSFTEEVVETQSREVEQMKKWLENWYGDDYVSDTNYLPMMGDLNSFEGIDLEKVYVEGMIRHHQGAVEMATAVLALNPRDEVREMAEMIVEVQQVEIVTLKGWLESKYKNIDAKDDVHHMMNIH